MAMLKLWRRFRDERWLDRARALAMHVTLQVELRLIHRRQEPSHAIGIEPQHEGQGVRRAGLVVVRAIEVGGAVVAGTGRFQPLVELAHRYVLRAHEHHVLEEMRKTGAPALLVARADLVEVLHGHDGHGAIHVENDLEPVGQRVFLVRNGRRGLRPE